MKFLPILLLAFLSHSVSAQFVATVQLNEDIEGLCDFEKVYALLPLKGQEEAVCSVSKPEIEDRLNAIEYLKEHPKLKDKGMMGMLISCEGEVVQCKIDNKTSSKELDRQIEAVFAELKDWKPGKLNGRKVDSSRLFSFTIRKGKLTLN